MSNQFKIVNKTDYLALADFEKLRKANDLINKWYHRFKITQKYFMPFLCDIQKNYQKYYDLLPAKYKASFKKDYPNMFYAAEVENALVEQFVPMVISILKRLKVEEYYQEILYLDGLLSVRNSVWKFQTHKAKASFFSFAYNGCMSRIWSRRIKLREEYQAKRKKVGIYNESDYGTFSIHKNLDPRTRTPEDILISKFDYDIDGLFSRAGLTDEEVELIELYMKRKDIGCENWVSAYRQNNRKEDGTEMSRQAIDNKIVHIQYKLWKLYSHENGLEFNDPKIRCVSRIRKVKLKRKLTS